LNAHLPSGRRVVLAALALPVVALVAGPGLARVVGLDGWDVRKHEQAHREAVESAHRLSAADALVWERIAIKEALVADLIDGRATLAEVTAQFTVLNQSRPDYLDIIRATTPGDTDEERMARNVIDHVRHRVADPAKRDRLRCRLECELADLLRNLAPDTE
jgi:hypothetical protein